MKVTTTGALTITAPRHFTRTKSYEALRGCFAENPGAGAGAGGAAAGAGAPAAGGAPGNAAAGAPAGGAGAPAAAAGKPAAGAGAGAPTAAEQLDTIESIIADDPEAAAAAGKVSAEDQRKYLVEKGGKADDLAKLDEAALQKAYDAQKTKDAAPAAKPGDIEIKVPDGIEIDEKVLTDFKALLSDDKLTPAERGQKLIEMHSQALQAAAKAATEAPVQMWYDTQKKWNEEVRADKEIGGEALKATQANIAKVITEVMGPDAKKTFEAMKLTGAANHPAICRLMARVSKLFVEGDGIAGNALSSAKSRSFAQRVANMYPSATGSQQNAG